MSSEDKKVSDLKSKVHSFKRSYINAIGVVVLVFLATLLLWFNSANNHQAVGATAATVKFQGEYQIGEGEWKPITEGEHISSTKGDVTLRGNFHLYAPNGSISAFLVAIHTLPFIRITSA